MIILLLYIHNYIHDYFYFPSQAHAFTNTNELSEWILVSNMFLYFPNNLFYFVYLSFSSVVVQYIFFIMLLFRLVDFFSFCFVEIIY